LFSSAKGKFEYEKWSFFEWDKSNCKIYYLAE
jgi:hypothetical protein